ncbi:SBBP repeat-containing protein [Saccharicrinis sp. FJH2]|uniref:SBBP repeat-containing protein n=1 Tax=Saccharicrinis sp. FJH65 TaxID=3344659 RepID=UPI0035F2B13F
MNRFRLLIPIAILLISCKSGNQKVETDEQLSYSLNYATFIADIDFGGPASSIYTDKQGYTYISGNTKNKDLPTTKGAFQTTLNGEKADAFIAKFDPENNLVFCTYIGGSKREHHTGLTVDEQGNIYLVGGTHSYDFPVTKNAYDRTFNGEKDWAGDVYLLKLDPTGSKLLFSTFIGGSVQETADVVHVDNEGNIIIGGCTLSSDFPTTENIIDREFRGFEAFLAKFNPTGEKLLFSTLLGGNNNDQVTCISTDNVNQIYIAGFTRSTDFPVTMDALRSKSENINDSEWWDGTDNYLMKISSDGSKILYSSYIGGKSRPIKTLNWKEPNKILIAGNVNSECFPITESALNSEPMGDRDGYISIFNSDKMELEYSTLLGGNSYDMIEDAFFLNEETILIGGETNSTDFPLTKNAMDTIYPVNDSLYHPGFLGERKFFVSLIDINKGQLLYSTYFNGGSRFNISSDEDGNIRYFGITNDTNFSLTQNAIRKEPTAFIYGSLKMN